MSEFASIICSGFFFPSSPSISVRSFWLQCGLFPFNASWPFCAPTLICLDPLELRSLRLDFVMMIYAGGSVSFLVGAFKLGRGHVPAPSPRTISYQIHELRAEKRETRPLPYAIVLGQKASCRGSSLGAAHHQQNATGGVCSHPRGWNHCCGFVSKGDTTSSRSSLASPRRRTSREFDAGLSGSIGKTRP